MILKFILVDSSKKTSIPFIVAGKKVGILTQKVAKYLENYPDTFELKVADNDCLQSYIKLKDHYQSFDERTKAVEKVVLDMASRNAHVALCGWRNEVSAKKI